MDSIPFGKTLIRKVTSCRSYCTNRTNRTNLYSIISPLGDPRVSVVPELDEWIEKGKKVRVSELQSIIRDLRKRKRSSHALQISEWMNKKCVCIFSPTQHAVQLDLIGKVRGFVSAESYFNNLKEQDKTGKTYGALLNCYVRQCQTDKSLSHLQKMKELGFASSSLTYNDIMCLYVNLGQHEKVPAVLAEMKQNNVSPDNFSYKICINSYGVRSDLEGMEKVLREMECQPHIVMDWNTYAVAANYYKLAGLTDKAINALKKSEERLDDKGGRGYNHLITLHASLGNKDEVLRLWDLLKTVHKRYINKDYIAMLESLAKLGDFKEAERVLKEWESSGNCYDFRAPNAVITGYCEKGLHGNAKALLEDLVEKGKSITPKSWSLVAAGYLGEGETEKALECMKAALSVHTSKGWKPNMKLMSSLLDQLGNKGSIEDVEAFVASLKTIIPVNRQMYHALLKARIRGGAEIDSILNDMKKCEIDEDEETKSILTMRPK